MTKGKNESAWEKLFVKYDIQRTIISKGVFTISSKQINEFREARLMTKFDFRSQLPKIFSDNELSILPISRGKYIIGNFETFMDFETSQPEVVDFDFPGYIDSIDYSSITSESTALNCAYVCGIIKEFVEDENVVPTVNGRMGSSEFEFGIDSNSGRIPIHVNNAQLEIDGGYEGMEFLSLIEAKNSISKDFIIRQLYYPFRLWNSKTSKKVKSIFLTYTNGIFHFREYEFHDETDYNSIKLIKEKKYRIREEKINTELLKDISRKARVSEEPPIAFPQADSFPRVINLCELLNEKQQLERDDITSNYDFDVRQTNYYTDAARYLGLIEKKWVQRKIVFTLTQRGESLFCQSISERQKLFIELILQHSVFNEVLKLYLKKYEEPTRIEVVQLMAEARLFNIRSASTFSRRASTVLSWVNWIMEQIED